MPMPPSYLLMTNCFKVEAIYCDGLDYYFLTDNSVILIEDSIIHSFNCKVTHVSVNIRHHFLTKLDKFYRKVISIAGFV